MNCPRDNHTLKFNDHRAHSRHECRECDGVLLQEMYLFQALGHAQGTTRAAAGTAPDLLNLPSSEIGCPRDGKRMRAIVHQDVEIDICPACRSIWLDHGEYDKIIEKERKKRGNGDGGGDVDVSPSAGGGGCGPDTSTDINFHSVVDFLGDAVGSLLDGV